MDKAALVRAEPMARAALQAAVGDPLDLAPFPNQGWANRAFAATVRGRELVVRLSDRPGTHAGFLREAWCTEQAAGVGVPGPEVLAVLELEGWAAMVLTRLPGRHVEDLPERAGELWEVLGRHARAIAGIPVTGVGLRFGYGEVPAASPDWGRHMEALTAWMAGARHLVDDGLLESREFDAVLRAAQRVRGWDFEPVLSHGDLGFDNALVDDAGVVRVIDWGCAQAQRAGVSELARLASWASAEAAEGFCRGFGLSEEARAELGQPVRDWQVWDQAAVLLEWYPREGGELIPQVEVARDQLRSLLADLGG